MVTFYIYLSSIADYRRKYNIFFLQSCNKELRSSSPPPLSSIITSIASIIAASHIETGHIETGHAKTDDVRTGQANKGHTKTNPAESGDGKGTDADAINSGSTGALNSATIITKGISLFKAGKVGDAYAVLHPLAEAGNAGAQYLVGIIFAKAGTMLPDDVLQQASEAITAKADTKIRADHRTSNDAAQRDADRQAAMASASACKLEQGARMARMVYIGFSGFKLKVVACVRQACMSFRPITAPKTGEPPGSYSYCLIESSRFFIRQRYLWFYDTVAVSEY